MGNLALLGQWPSWCPYHSRWHTERTLSPLLGMESRALHMWASSLPPSHSQVWHLQNQHIHFLYGKWDQRFCLKQLLLWFLFRLSVLVRLYFAWPVGSHSALADWNIIFQLTGYLCWRNNLSQPWARCSLLISRQCLWLKIMSAAFEEYYSWHRKRSFGSSFIVCIMHYIFKFLKIKDINYVLLSFSWQAWLLHSTKTSVANICRINFLTKQWVLAWEFLLL